MFKNFLLIFKAFILILFIENLINSSVWAAGRSGNEEENKMNAPLLKKKPQIQETDDRCCDHWGLHNWWDEIATYFEPITGLSGAKQKREEIWGHAESDCCEAVCVVLCSPPILLRQLLCLPFACCMCMEPTSYGY